MSLISLTISKKKLLNILNLFERIMMDTHDMHIPLNFVEDPIGHCPVNCSDPFT